MRSAEDQLGLGTGRQRVQSRGIHYNGIGIIASVRSRVAVVELVGRNELAKHRFIVQLCRLWIVRTQIIPVRTQRNVAATKIVQRRRHGRRRVFVQFAGATGNDLAFAGGLQFKQHAQCGRAVGVAVIVILEDDVRNGLRSFRERLFCGSALRSSQARQQAGDENASHPDCNRLANKVNLVRHGVLCSLILECQHK